MSHPCEKTLIVFTQGGRVTAEYSAPIQGCVITSLHQNITITTMVYSMVYDFIVVCLVCVFLLGLSLVWR